MDGPEQKMKLKQMLSENQIVPSRTIDLADNKEIILQLLSFEETSNVMKLMQERGVQIIDQNASHAAGTNSVDQDSMNF